MKKKMGEKKRERERETFEIAEPLPNTGVQPTLFVV